MFKECADIQTADMLKLPVPALVGGKPTNIQLKPSEIQKQMVAELGERADKIRNKMVKPYEDNMLKITNDGRKLALDQRLIDPDLPDDPDSKVNICVGKIFEIWEQTMPQRSAQLVFCDLSTPKAGVFNVYDDMKAKLIERGIPETEIAFIHEANTDARKTELFGKVRSGAVRVLMGSTAKMGAGTNVQQRLVALHHLDVPWRPSDIEQREGRILRQGNENKEVYVFRYVTEGTFDAYSWQLIENKQKFIGQIMTSKSPARSCDDMDEAALSYADEFTGAKNLSLLCDIKRLVSQAQIGDTLRRVGLNPSDKRPFRKYSLGMKQRLGIAAAIVESPDLILLDEPFNALDESGIKEIRDLLRELRQKGKLIVLTCHDRQQMESLADEIIAMREGRIVNVDKNCHEEV